MGRVWVAEHLGLHTQVVVKLMAEEMEARPDGAERFAREAAACAAIKSPHVVQIFDHGLTAAGVPYIVMELLEGKDLGAYLAEKGRMEPALVLALVTQMGKALSKAHKASIVHRDIKPDNIFLCDTDDGQIFVKLLDFGTAKKEGPSSSRTTVPGQIMGTPYYMSPEQSVGGEIDERSDIWSLGVVVFEALTGRKPFDGVSVGAITIAIHGVLPKMTELVPELPALVDEWFARACAQLPKDRFASVREATNAFAEAITGVAPIDQPTESLAFPPPQARGGSTPVRAVTRPIQPLSASLPEPGSERRATTIAAGIVMAAAAVAMAAIVLGRPSAPAPMAQRTPEPPPSAQAAKATPPVDPPPLAETAPRAEPPPEPATAATTATAAAKPATVPLPARDAHAKPIKRPRGVLITRPKDPKENGHEDDDLVRLQKAAAQHAGEATDPASRASSNPSPAPSSSLAPLAPLAPGPQRPAPESVSPAPPPLPSPPSVSP